MCQYYEKIETGRFGGSKRIDGLIGVVVMTGFNMATLFYFLMATDFQNYFYHIPIIQPYFLHKLIYGGGTGLVIFIILYYSLGKSYDGIYLKYLNETFEQRKKRGWNIVLYIIITFVMFAFSIYIMEQNRSEEWKKEHRKEEEVPKIQFKLPKKEDAMR